MFNTYEFETDVVAFLLQQPIYYTQRKKALGSLPFSDKYLARVWKWLKEAQDRYGAWPTRSELLERTKRELKDSKGEYLDLEFSSYEEVIDSLYEKKPTASTGEELNRWVAEQHRQRMVKELADTPLEDLASYFKTHQSRINEFRTLHFQDTDLGLNLFSPGGRQRVLAQAIAYASGIVVPTGFPRLDETLGGGGRQGEVNCILAPTNSGKAQPLSAKIMTPSGFVTMGEIKVGDLVYDWDGNPVAVTGVFPQGEKEIYEITFDDGTKTECCDEHLWWVRHFSNTKKDEWTVLPLKSFKDKLTSGRYKRNDWQIPSVKPLKMEPKELPLHPYVLGALLGDGGLFTGTVIFTNTDDNFVDYMSSLLPESIEFSPVQNNEDRAPSYRLVKKNRAQDHYGKNEIKAILSDLGLMGCKSAAKFIPEPYLYGSVEQRLALLHGLMDTDGHNTGKGGTVDYVTASEKLRDQVVFLVRSLGGKAHLRKDRIVNEVTYYRVGFSTPMCPFRLPRKAATWKPKEATPIKRIVVDVTFKRKEVAQCISVDSPTRSYLTDDFIVTHNTVCLINLALNMLQAGKRVVFVYLDSTEEEMATRLLTSYMREPINPLTDQDKLDAKLAEVEARYKDMFFCKQFPMKSVSCLDIEAYLNNVKTYCYQLDKEAGKDEEDCGVVHALLVDYMEVLKVEQKGENFWISAEAGAQELNALAISQKVCLWTATQGGTEAMKSDKITLDMAAGAKSRFHAIANVLILCTESSQKQQIERLFTLDVAKIRRPARFLSLPFIMYADKQLIEENENVAPRESGVAIEAPMQNPEDLGRGSRGATRDAVNSAFS